MSDAKSKSSPEDSGASPASPSIRIHVLFFGVLAQQVGQQYLTLDLTTPATVQSAVARLQEQFPSIGALQSKLAFAVNLVYVPVTSELRDRDELALIPPVSGG